MGKTETYVLGAGAEGRAGVLYNISTCIAKFVIATDTKPEACNENQRTVKN